MNNLIYMLSAVEKFKKNCIVASPIGGSGSRLVPVEVAYGIEKLYGKNALEELYVPKPLVEIGGKKLIEIFIDSYKRADIKRFAFLIGKGTYTEDIKNYLGDGSKFGVEIRYSDDPNVPKVGKGKALANAYLNGTLDVEKPLLWGFPDDIILEPYVDRSIKRFCSLQKESEIYALLVLVSRIKSQYGMVVVNEKGLIERFKEKEVMSLGKKAVNTGRGIIDSEHVWPYIERHINIDSAEPIELEDKVLPILAKSKRLGYMKLKKPENWLPVNDSKDLKRATQILYTNPFIEQG